MTQADTLEQLMATRVPRDQGGRQGSHHAPQPRVISVTSGKGGVGKTNVSANLAYCLATAGKKILLLDADLNLANIDVLLGLTPRYTIQHVLNGEKSLLDVLLPGPGGMKILPASSGIMELGDLTEKQQLFFLSEMETLGADLDFLLIDTAAGINNNVIYFNLAAQDKIIVLTPEPTSLTDAYALIKVLSNRHDVKRFRILINQSTSAKEAMSVYQKLSGVADRFLSTISLDYLGHIPYDRKLPEAVKKQRLVAEFFPESTTGKSIRELANSLIMEPADQTNDGNIKFFWKGVLDL
ncbi:MAG: MinD/ParA family protein [Proteobacteria bacterium]|nr:MinD/ParA family protein [Pseudomonadota bacterium]MBU1685962.1 MinD/ParA family protein [Pseudomonadota bacterium]